MNYLVILFAFVTISAPSLAQSPLVGTSTMNIYIKGYHFPDVVNIKQDQAGALSGTLHVPNAFTAPLEKITLQGNKFSFEIEADEGNGPFRVKYEGEIHPSGKVYIGYAHLMPSGQLLGGFVGQIH